MNTYISIRIGHTVIHLIPLPWGRRARKQERTKNGGTEGETCTSIRPIDAHIVDEEQMGKKRRKKQSESPIHLPPALQSPPTTRRDHTVSLFWKPSAHRGSIYIYIIFFFTPLGGWFQNRPTV